MNKAQDSYYNCKELYYEGDLAESVARNITRRGIINQFTDVIYEIITGQQPCFDIVFITKVRMLVNSLLVTKEIPQLITMFGDDSI